MTLERISAALMSLIAALGFAMALLLASSPVVEAGVTSMPAGGWGIDRPAPTPRPDGFGTTAGGDPNS